MSRAARDEVEGEPSADLDQLAHEVIGAAIEIHRHLGPGFLENVYQGALEVEMRLRGIEFQAQPPITVGYKGARGWRGSGRSPDRSADRRVEGCGETAADPRSAGHFLPQGDRLPARTTDKLQRTGTSARGKAHCAHSETAGRQRAGQQEGKG